MILTLKDKVWWFALYSRGFVLITSAISNFIIPDHVADAFIAPKVNSGSQESFGDLIVNYLFGGLVRWDAQYFIHISMYGYTYENSLAFFPLFPLLSRVLARILYLLLGGVLSESSLHIISAICINWFCFVKSASILYDLSLRVLKSERLAYKASILYCVNPASIFFSALYSESLYACLTFYGMLKCGCGISERFSVDCGIIFGLSTITRSNGILNVGFIAYKGLKTFALQTLPKFVQELKELKIKILWMFPAMLLVTGAFALPYILSAILSLCPFVTFQAYSYYKYCIPQNHSLPEFLITFAKTNDLIIPGGTIQEKGEEHWCKSLIPLSYSYVQSHYWNVGFLRYYRWKQIPQFILALPIVWIIMSESLKYILKNHKHCLYLGLRSSELKKNIKEKSSLNCNKETHLAENIFPYVIHAVFITMFSVLCAHVQVTTRMISSSSPLLYWFCAKMTLEGNPSNGKNVASKLSIDLTKISKRQSEKKKDFVRYDIEPMENMCSTWKVFVLALPPTSKSRFIHFYFWFYTIVGTVLFSNFLPWT